SIDLQNLSKGATLKLPDGKYTYLGDGVFEGPDKGKIINTGKVDPATGNSIYQRINPNGSFSSSFLMISDDGMQISNVNKPDGLFNINNQNRPTPQQSEKYVGQMLPKVAHAQISYKNGKEVPYGTEGSVRPDWCIGEICSIEVKNYNIHSNRANLISDIVAQSKEREKHLLKGMIQEIKIDLRGQSYSDEDLFEIRNQIESKSKGIISKDAIDFIEN
ncbi:hypothetical protein, partial [Glaesserella parasuis]|uniref:hypothetical protein n=4 Tax=Glaesserella parasuis TaxID=738 RepID=UPI0013651F58